MHVSFLIIAIKFLVIISKKLVELNNESFNRMVEANKYEKNKKLLVIFYTKNCLHCREAINIISKEIIDKYKNDIRIDFGKVDCDLRENIWLNLRFNITRIPYIIIIQGDYFYELNSHYDKFELNYFINDIKDKRELLRIPDDVNLVEKRIIILKYTINYFEKFFEKYFRIRISKNIIIFILIIFLLLLLWIIKYFLELCCCNFLLCKICRKKQEKKNIIQESQMENLSGKGSFVSGSELESKEGDDSMYTSDISDSLFNEEIDESKLKIKYKNKID